MKAIVNNKSAQQGRPFPKLMICTDSSNPGMIILFRAAGAGMVVSPGKAWEIGESADSWDTSVFKDFDGSVTLSSD